MEKKWMFVALGYVLLLAGLEFVLDAGVAARFVDPDYRKRMTVENMIAALRSAR